MSNTKTIEQIEAELDAKIPREAVESRSSGFGGKALSYLPGHYVIDRLNKIFGPSGWSYAVKELKQVFAGEVNNKHYVSYTATVELRTDFGDGKHRFDTDVGFGDGMDGSNPGKPYELATKEAVTDALKRCAKSLGMSMGLALYDKTQENVADEAPITTTSNKEKDIEPTQATPGRSPARGKSATNAGTQTVVAPIAATATKAPVHPVQAGDAAGSPAPGKSEVSSSPTPSGDVDKVIASILAAARVLDKKELYKLKEFEVELRDVYKVSSIYNLSATQANTIYNQFVTKYPVLGLQ